MNHRLPSLFVLLIVLTGIIAWPARAKAEWKAGAAKTVITPPRLMWMAGYGNRDHPAEGKLTDLWAKALVLEDDGGRRLVLVTLDVVGIDRALAQRICEDLKQQHGLERRQIALATSHTHTGPVVEYNLPALHYAMLDETQQELVRQYAEHFRGKVTAVVGQAIEKLAPAQVTWGSGYTTFAVNRRNNNERNVPALRETGKLVGPVDHDVPVLAVRDGEGKLQAVVFGYACHATVLSFYKWSGDYPGFAQIELEKSHPGCMALFWAGCGADQNPLPRREVELAQTYGKKLALAVNQVLAAPMRPVRGELSSQYNEIDLAFSKIPTRKEIEQDAASSNKYAVGRAKMFLKQLDAGKPLPKTYPYPVQLWRLGDEVQWFLLGGEVVVDFALRLKTELLGERTWVAGYANDVMAYIPSRRVLREGGYEGGGAMVIYGQPSPWTPDVEEKIVQEAHRQSK